MKGKAQAQHPTTTSLVLDYLKEADDFRTRRQLERALNLNASNIRRALMHLRAHKAVEMVQESDGMDYWFATPESDNRAFKLAGICDYEKPNAVGAKHWRARKAKSMKAITNEGAINAEQPQS